ncbi:MAG: hypothetical protein EXR07_12575 [Acetobacteraceae bacterium]|nr:hypothetical protein [Acetobacteraceae bacterium]
MPDARLIMFKIGDSVRLKSIPAMCANFDIKPEDIGIVFQVAHIARNADHIAVRFPRDFIPLLQSSLYELVAAVRDVG